MTRKYICPSCKAKEGVRIVYGYPSEKTFEARERGEIALGGCVIGDNDPERQCLNCGHEWRVQPRKYVCPSCGAKEGIALSGGFPSFENMEAIMHNETLFGRGFRPQKDSDRLCLKCACEWHSKRRSARD